MATIPLDPSRRHSLTRASMTPNRRERILALAADLAEDPEAVDLDTIDGEFYWRCCRADLIESLEAMCVGRPRPIGERGASDEDLLERPKGTFAEHLGPTGAFDYLRDGLRFVQDFIALADEASRLFPDVVWRRFLDGERVAMRAAEAEILRPATPPGSPSSLALRVFSGAWQGNQVEQEVRRLAQALGERKVGEARDPLADGVDLRISFAFGDHRRTREGMCDGDDVRYPYVEVITPLPLPPKQVIAREYDALVRGVLGWHRFLPGGGSRQDRLVAIRTWAVGLLAADGVKFVHAMRAVAEGVGLDEVSQPRFNGDRQRLIERVPEARGYVRVRGVGDDDARSGHNGEHLDGVENAAAGRARLQPEGLSEEAYT